jgi:hypothetical protein
MNKMKIYWLANYTFAGGPEMECLAGPFPTWSKAFEAQEELMAKGDDTGLIVEQMVELI